MRRQVHDFPKDDENEVTEMQLLFYTHALSFCYAFSVYGPGSNCLVFLSCDIVDTASVVVHELFMAVLRGKDLQTLGNMCVVLFLLRTLQQATCGFFMVTRRATLHGGKDLDRLDRRTASRRGWVCFASSFLCILRRNDNDLTLHFSYLR